MGSVGSGSGFKIDTSGLSEARALTSGALSEIEAAAKEASELAAKMAQERNAVRDGIVESFENIPDGKDPLDDEIFNDIINNLVKGEDDNDDLSTEATEHLKSFILDSIGKQDGDKFSSFTQEQANEFIDLLTQIVLGNYGADKELSTDEFEAFLKGIGFQGPVTTSATPNTESDEPPSDEDGQTEK